MINLSEIDPKKYGVKTAADVAAFSIAGGVGGLIEGIFNLLPYADTPETAVYAALLGLGAKKIVDVVQIRSKKKGSSAN